MTTGPFRDDNRACPTCKHVLREFHGRLCCDTCEGMMLTIEELSRAIVDLTKVEPTYEFKDVAAGSRACPWCAQPMATCKLRVVVEADLAKPSPRLDKCEHHGLWFDGNELASVLEKVYAKVSPKHSAMGWQGNAAGIQWWRGR